MRNMMRLKFVRKRVRMVAHTDLLGESGLLGLGDMSDFTVRNIISELYEILHVVGR